MTEYCERYTKDSCSFFQLSLDLFHLLELRLITYLNRRVNTASRLICSIRCGFRRAVICKTINQKRILFLFDQTRLSMKRHLMYTCKKTTNVQAKKEISIYLSSIYSPTLFTFREWSSKFFGLFDLIYTCFR